MERIFNALAEGFDLPILDWISQHLQCDFLDAIMVPITYLGEAGIFWIAFAIVLMLLPKQRRNGLAMGIALLIGLVICNLIMKPLFARIRPYDYQMLHFGKEIALLIPAQHDFSFPSGHTISSFEAATALLLGSKRLGIPALVIACCVAFSRLYLYIHYPTDVLCSIILGIGIGFIGHIIAKRSPIPNIHV